MGVASAAGKLARLCPGHVRLVRFRRSRLGRRGLAEDQVYAFVRRVVDELTARDAVEAGLREENARLKRALSEWRSQQRNGGRWPARPVRWTEPGGRW